ncbi:MAG: prolipoprotein diacylglyceryl transferase [Eubacteriaceae bacterium]
MYPFIKFFNYTIPTFSIFFILGTGFACLLALITQKKYKLYSLDTFLFGLFSLIGGVIGAKILYIIIYFPILMKDLNLLYVVLNSGGAIYYGGVLGGIIGGYLYSKAYKLAFLKFSDMYTPCLALAHGFGRIGCFFNGCCFGIHYDGIGAIHYPYGGLAPSGIGIFPIQLVESGFLFCLAFLLLYVLKNSTYPGKTTSLYLILYGIIRFFNEFLRDDPRGGLSVFSTSQCLSLFFICLGFFFLFNLKNQDKIKKFES